jgi:hypothetical protein
MNRQDGRSSRRLAGIAKGLALVIPLCGFADPALAQAPAGGAAVEQAIAKVRERTTGCAEHRTATFADPAAGRSGDKPVKGITFRWDEFRLQQADLVGRLRFKNALSNSNGADGATAQEYTFKVALAALSPAVEVRENVAGSGVFSMVAKCTVPGCHQYRNREMKLANPRSSREANAAAWREEAFVSKLDDWAPEGSAKEATLGEIWLLTCGSRTEVEAAAKALSQAISASAAR